MVSSSLIYQAVIHELCRAFKLPKSNPDQTFAIITDMSRPPFLANRTYEYFKRIETDYEANTVPFQTPSLLNTQCDAFTGNFLQLPFPYLDTSCQSFFTPRLFCIK